MIVLTALSGLNPTGLYQEVCRPSPRCCESLAVTSCSSTVSYHVENDRHSGRMHRMAWLREDVKSRVGGVES